MAASRETIPDKPWNEKLRNGVVDAFVEAVREVFNEDVHLRYDWMHYLPIAHLEDFWGPLSAALLGSLRDLNIVEPYAGGGLKRVSNLRTLPSDFLHDGKPLLPDLYENIYLSDKYDAHAVAALRDLGLRNLSRTEMLDRVEADLEKGENSHIRSTELEDSWHTAFLELLEYVWDGKVSETRIRGCDILPLSTGEWVAPCTAKSGDQIYFPHVDDANDSPLIPEGLGIRTLDPVACVVAGRASFYRALGVEDVPTELVVERVLETNKSTDPLLTVQDYVAQFEVLYWFASDLTSVSPECLTGMSHFNWLLPTSALYFRSDQQYHAEKLLEFMDTSLDCGYDFLNDAYLQSTVSNQFRHGKSWRNWLETVAGIREYPDLTDAMNKQLLNEAIADIISYKPSKLVGLLGAYWQDYESRLTPGIQTTLMEAKVPCQNGELREMQGTFLPTEETISKSNEFGVRHLVPFLAIGESNSVVEWKDWFFLERFGVCCSTDSRFHFESLRALKKSTVSEDCSVSAPVKLYASLGAIAQLKDKQRLQVS